MQLYIIWNFTNNKIYLTFLHKQGTNCMRFCQNLALLSKRWQTLTIFYRKKHRVIKEQSSFRLFMTERKINSRHHFRNQYFNQYCNFWIKIRLIFLIRWLTLHTDKYPHGFNQLAIPDLKLNFLQHSNGILKIKLLSIITICNFDLYFLSLFDHYINKSMDGLLQGLKADDGDSNIKI